MKTTAKQYKIYLIIGIMVLFAAIFSATYAVFRKSSSQTSDNMISTLDCIDISITGNTDALSLTSYPMTDIEGSTQLPYRFTVQNNCSTYVEYQIIMSVEQSSTITNKEYIKIDLAGLKSNKRVLLSELTEEPQPALTGYKNNYTLLSNSFNGEESHVYNFRMWLSGENENIWTDETIIDQTLSVRLSIIGVTKPEPSELLNERILAQGGGKVAIEAKGDPDFSKIATLDDTGLYAAEDEYGTSYYYRGTKELNNNLIWGGFQWKIVRINGDGSIRLLYNGTEAQFNTNGTINDTGEDTQIEGTSKFNSNHADAKYVGYMYGGAVGEHSTQRFGEISAAATYNETNSTIKDELDDWYEANILDKPFETDVANNLFCNDRQLKSEVGGGATGTGYGYTAESGYASDYRLYTNKKPTLKCGLKNDRFTTSADSIIGNGVLTYSVGLLTADEASMAGLVYNTNNNTTNYLYTNQSWWSFSPYYMFCPFANCSARMLIVNSSGHLYMDWTIMPHGSRPSVSLISGVRATGEGSAADPFVVVTAPTLGEAILAQEVGGPAMIEAKATPDFSKIATSEYAGLYAAPDEYGMSYYYRGTKELNNNLIWGGFQWKIVRINGDGSIRLVYNGTQAQFISKSSMNDTGEDTQIGTSRFNSNHADAKYVGYMYGGAVGEHSTQRFGEISAAATYNETNSTIKDELDDWYEANILDKPFETDVANNLFCNDRQLQSEVGGDATGPGYGACYLKCVTHYAASYRIIENKTPTLKCGLKNDRFTTGTDIELGNGSLTYPVGLLTSDEASMAGLVHNTNNTTNYLYTNQDWWLLTPDYVDWNGYANGWHIDLSGKLYDHWATYLYGARPSVSLISGVRVTGIGSANDPFKAL